MGNSNFPSADTHRARAGFTLIELLAVLLILGVLAYFLVPNLITGQETTREGAQKNRIAQVASGLGLLSDDTGIYPFTKIPVTTGTAPNDVNVGAESLYLALCAQGAPGYGTLDKVELLCNTDGDSLDKRPKGFETQELFELADAWGNPLAYIHHLDYERVFTYRAVDTENGEENDFEVKARKNPKTGRWEEPHGFQLVSAGSDGKFGTEDDLTNYKK